MSRRLCIDSPHLLKMVPPRSRWRNDWSGDKVPPLPDTKQESARTLRGDWMGLVKLALYRAASRSRAIRAAGDASDRTIAQPSARIWLSTFRQRWLGIRPRPRGPPGPRRS